MRKPTTLGLIAQALIVLTVMLGGCATPKAVGKGATEGALEEVQEATKARPNEPPPVQEVASNVIKGTLVELDDPETRAQLSRIIGTATQSAVTSMLGNGGYRDTRNNDAARGWGGGPTQFGANSMMAMGPMGALGGRISEGFTLGMSRQLQVELGEDGQGPLGQSLAGVMKQATQAAVSGAAMELAPLAGDCAGLDRKQCADMRIQELSRSAANGFVQGLGAALQIPLLVVAFASGLVIAIVAALLFAWLRRRPRPAAAIS